MSDEIDEIADVEPKDIDEKAILGGALVDDIDLDDDVVLPLTGDEFTEDYDLDTGGVNFHDEDTDQNY